MKTEAKPKGWNSRGYLPHFDGGEIPQFLTIRLGDAVPSQVIEGWEQELKQEPEAARESILRRRIEAYIDQGYGACYLKEPFIAEIVENALLHFDGTRYRLWAWVVMPNHAHWLFTPGTGYELATLLHSIKSFTAQRANQRLQRHGQFWQEDYFDRFTRDADHFAAVVAYIENNPVKAKLCERPEDWRFSSAWRRQKKTG